MFLIITNINKMETSGFPFKYQKKKKKKKKKKKNFFFLKFFFFFKLYLI